MRRAAPDVVVADAGPLIGLAIVDGLRWMRKLFRSIVIPGAVASELHLDSGMPGAKALATARDQGWLKVVPVAEVPDRLLDAVDRGEAEAIVLAKQMAIPLLIDEHRGRVAAKHEGVSIFGSGALLLQAKDRGLIREVRPHLDALLQAQYRLSDALRREILRLAGEGGAPGFQP